MDCVIVTHPGVLLHLDSPPLSKLLKVSADRPFRWDRARAIRNFLLPVAIAGGLS